MTICRIAHARFQLIHLDALIQMVLVMVGLLLEKQDMPVEHGRLEVILLHPELDSSAFMTVREI
jgi:hypothetical protein